jgi:hypothetical protein
MSDRAIVTTVSLSGEGDGFAVRPVACLGKDEGDEEEEKKKPHSAIMGGRKQRCRSKVKYENARRKAMGC